MAQPVRVEDAVQAGIKLDMVYALAQQIDASADRGRWAAYVDRTSAKAKGYERLIKDLNACLEGSKILTYTPDGIPAFIDSKGD